MQHVSKSKDYIDLLGSVFHKLGRLFRKVSRWFRASLTVDDMDPKVFRELSNMCAQGTVYNYWEGAVSPSDASCIISDRAQELSEAISRKADDSYVRKLEGGLVVCRRDGDVPRGGFSLWGAHLNSNALNRKKAEAKAKGDGIALIGRTNLSIKCEWNGRCRVLSFTTTIGSSKSCGIVSQFPKVSRRHGKFLWMAQDGWAFKDLNSTNGSTLNGQDIDPQSCELLHPENTLELAKVAAVTVLSC